jgi:hypothetical protein
MLLMIDKQHTRSAAFMKVPKRVTTFNIFNDFICATILGIR